MTLVTTTKTILCYGDSNTWGNVPRSDERYPRNVRWPGALQNLLGKEFDVISEGLCGRTLVAADPAKPHRTGITHLQSILESADPIDGLIIMLGTNDAKSTYNLTPAEIAGHLLQTIEFVRNIKDLEKMPEILVICPPPVIIPETNDLDPRIIPGLEAFKALPNLYKEVAQRHGCGFINSGDYISSSKVDGYHFDKEAHLKLAEVICGWIKQNI
jgi:lysophospholipase L1-like esterase